MGLENLNNQLRLSVVMMCSNMMVFAAETTSTEDAIIAQAVALDENMTLDDGSYTVITLGENNSNSRSVNGESKAIQKVDSNDGETTVTTIIPFRVAEDGELINSFEYISNQMTRSSTVPTTYVNITVTITANFDTLTKLTGKTYYRHNGVEAYWNSNISDVTLYELDVLFGSNGDLYKYPDCYNDHNASFISSDYYTSSHLNVTGPIKNNIYDQYDPMPTDNVLYLSKSIEHGGAVTFYMDYSIDNVRGSYQDPGFGVFSK